MGGNGRDLVDVLFIIFADDLPERARPAEFFFGGGREMNAGNVAGAGMRRPREMKWSGNSFASVLLAFSNSQRRTMDGGRI